MANIVPQKTIENRILVFRGKKVMLDRYLAELYGVETRVLIQAVKRNLERFPSDFMFQLIKKETDVFSRSQSVILKRGQNIKYLPYAFTEQGVAMLSSVLKSKKAIQTNIQIMRAFTKLGHVLLTHIELKRKIESLEGKVDIHDKQLKAVLKHLLEPPKLKKPKCKMGFAK